MESNKISADNLNLNFRVNLKSDSVSETNYCFNFKLKFIMFNLECTNLNLKVTPSRMLVTLNFKFTNSSSSCSV